MIIRHLNPSDYNAIISVVDHWWYGRKMSKMLPKLFFEHFRKTSLILEKEEEIIGFLIGFLSQTHLQEAYIHFVGIHPDFRGQGLGKSLYQKFFEVIHGYDRQTVKCVTSPLNKNSIEFHLSLGFEIQQGNSKYDQISYFPNYDGEGEDRVLFTKHLQK
jgi:ribosomal protein S18 acetylase RimI-like enzyme